MSKSNQNQSSVAVVHLGALTTDGTVIPAMHLPKKTIIKSVKVMNGAAIAASDVNYVQLTLKKGSTTIAEIDTRAAHENGLAQNVSKALNLVAGQEEQAALSDLTLTYNEAGTAALTDAKLFIEYSALA